MATIVIGDQRTEIRKEKKNLPGCNYGTTDHHENGHFNSHRLCYTKFLLKKNHFERIFCSFKHKTYPRI